MPTKNARRATRPKHNPLPATIVPVGFDPDAAATGDGLFGLDTTPAHARVVVIPVPFDATTSYRPGTAAAVCRTLADASITSRSKPSATPEAGGIIASACSNSSSIG